VEIIDWKLALWPGMCYRLDTWCEAHFLIIMSHAWLRSCGLLLSVLLAAMFWPNDLPGLGIDIDEAEAAKYPWPTDKGLTGQGTSGQIEWTTVRKRDGSITPP